MNWTKRGIVIAGMALLLSGCAGLHESTVSPHSAPKLVASDVAEDGRMTGIVVSRRYSDFFIRDGKEVRREIEVGWDYDRATAFQRTYDLEGKLLKTEVLAGADIGLTDREDERVKALVKGYPTLKDISKQPGVVIWGGGFVLREPGDVFCDRGSRCIHAILSTDNGVTAVAHAIVDLQRDRVVYPDYDMEQYRTTAKNSMGSK